MTCSLKPWQVWKILRLMRARKCRQCEDDAHLALMLVPTVDETYDEPHPFEGLYGQPDELPASTNLGKITYFKVDGENKFFLPYELNAEELVT